MPETKHTAGGPAVPSTTLVQCDQTTIIGDGSHERPLHISSGVLGPGGGPGGVTVVTDGTTVLGDGSSGDPIRVAPSGDPGGTLRAAFRGGATTPHPGQPVRVCPISESGGITTVQPSTATTTNVDSESTVDAIVAVVHDDDTVSVQPSGLVVLTTAQWDAVTGQTGGLVLGTRYYLAPFPASARLVAVRPTALGVQVSEVGVGLNATTMLVDPKPPISNVDGSFLIADLAGQPLAVGSAVWVSNAGEVSPAVSDVSVLAAQAIGILVGYDPVNSQRAVVQLDGVVELTTAQWNVVSPSIFDGLAPGNQYYVGTSAHAGSLTFAAPVAGAKTQVGVALSPTQLILAVPVPIRLT